MPVHHSPGGTSITGPAIDGYRAALCRQALRMWQVGIKSHRGAKLKDLLAIATEYTGKPYTGKKQLGRAIADLNTLLEARSFDQIGDTRQANELVGGPASALTE